MEDDQEWADIIQECYRLISDSTEILEDLKQSADSEDVLRPANLHNLYDLVEDAALSCRIQHAQMNLARRQTKDSL